MEHLVAGIVALAQAHALLAYSLALVLAGAESLPVFGAAVPGSGAIVALGVLVPSGALGFWPLVLATTAGAIVGDGFSFWLGHHYRAEAATIWPLRHHPGLISQGEAFFAHHGGKAIVAARFTPGVRAVVPLVAGIAGMPMVNFYSVNVLSAVLWAPAHVVMGVLIGASLTVLGAIAGRLAALVLVVFSLLAVIIWLTPRAVRWLVRTAARLQEPVHAWATSRETRFRRQVLSLLDPNRPELNGLITLGAFLAVGLWVFLGVLQDVLSGDPLVRADQAVLQLVQSLRVAAFDRVVVAVTELGDATVTVVVALVAVLWLVWHRAWRAAFYCVAAIAGSAAFSLLLKLTLQQDRPQPLYAGLNSFSFPSSHTTVSVALYGFLAVLIGREVGMRWRIGTVLVAVLLASSIAFSRLYLGAHWPSDVAAGFAFGVAWMALLGIAYLQHTPQPIRAGGLAGVVGITLLAVGAYTLHWLTTLICSSTPRRNQVEQ
jgi:undecaprenyl-diphosphatase